MGWFPVLYLKRCLWTRLLQLAARVGLGFSMFSVPRVEPNWGTGLRETKLIVSRGASHKVFCYTSQLKNRKNLLRIRLLDAGWLTNLPRFQEAWPDRVRVWSSSCCFPRKLEILFSLFKGVRVSEFWPTTRDTLSSNRKKYLSWEVEQYVLFSIYN